MILQPSNVELTKVNYYDKYRNVGISTISREVFENEFNKNIIIKKNIFGHRWVLKVNEVSASNKNKTNCKFIVYIGVFCCIVIAVAFGIFFTFERKFSNKFKNATKINNITVNSTLEDYFEIRNKNTTVLNLPKTKTNRTFCIDCLPEDVCLKIQETEKPKCHPIINKKDPTGCGGLCKINIQYCQQLDYRNKVYQCSNVKNILKCPVDNFNCGNRCVPLTKKCDGVLHCSNKSDETNCDCNLTSHFHCSNFTSCIEKSKKCDGRIDCWDKSDEKDCKEHCPKEDFPCLNGQCIPKDNFCDGILHCQDGSDEPQGCIL